MAYLTDLTDGWYAITNPVHQVGFGWSCLTETVRVIWYWQHVGEVAKGYPWWDGCTRWRSNPGTSYPPMGWLRPWRTGRRCWSSATRPVETRLCAVAFSGIGVCLRSPHGRSERDRNPLIIENQVITMRWSMASSRLIIVADSGTPQP